MPRCEDQVRDCNHSHAHITDSRFYRSRYATEESRAIFCDLCRYERWLFVEAALALSGAELGIIPEWAAEEIARKAHLEHIDLEEVERDLTRTGHSLVPLIRALERACDGGAGEFVHYGATTQDIQDTAQSLELHEVLHLVERDLGAILAGLVELARCHRDTLMVGRTHSQQALPMTFGLKVAVWIDELLRDLERVTECRERVLVAQLFGGVGTMEGFGERGIELLDRFADRLGLAAPRVAWHVARDRVAEFLSTLAIVTGTLARIANEIRSLARSEVREVEPGFRPGKVGSSTMPHKRNPEGAEQVVVLARLVKAQAMLGFEGLIAEHERDSRSLRLEWVTVTDASLHACAALAITKEILSDLVVRESTMRKRAARTAEMIGSEALMFALGDHVGKQTAHHLVYEATQSAREEDRALLDIVREMPEISGHLDPEEIKRALTPERHLGLSRTLVERVLADADRWLKHRKAPSAGLQRQTHGAPGEASVGRVVP